ncbi:hypothetical protein [Candidatus Thiosymbion oneisti]|uniref:hypothetical protein n=1 Tax=Candidatus Thiosymbion oneisti TaxID=589554 RepID=UPI00105E54A2|nr:hypothetical protein [Candidatus Thiosymbion oneisti]
MILESFAALQRRCKAILNDLALFGEADVLRSTHKGALIVCQVSTGVGSGKFLTDRLADSAR